MTGRDPVREQLNRGPGSGPGSIKLGPGQATISSARTSGGREGPGERLQTAHPTPDPDQESADRPPGVANRSPQSGRSGGGAAPFDIGVHVPCRYPPQLIAVGGAQLLSNPRVHDRHSIQMSMDIQQYFDIVI